MRQWLVTIFVSVMIVVVAQEHGLDIATFSKDRFISAMMWQGATPEEVQTWLQSDVNVNARDENFGNTVLMIAAANTNKPEVISTLLRAGADVDAQNDSGDTALSFAARENDNPEVLLTLVKAGADVNAGGFLNYTPLMWAARSNDSPEVIAALLRADAKVNTRNEYDQSSALMIAARFNENPDVMTALLRAGADVNAKDSSGETALMLAAENTKNPEIISLLLQAGADVKALDNDGDTVMMRALQNPTLNTKIVTILRQAGGEVSATSLFSFYIKSFVSNHTEMFSLIVTGIFLGVLFVLVSLINSLERLSRLNAQI